MKRNILEVQKKFPYQNPNQTKIINLFFPKSKSNMAPRKPSPINPKWPPTNQNQAHIFFALSFCPASWNTPTYPTNLCTPNNLAALL